MTDINYLALREAERAMLLDLRPDLMVTHNFGHIHPAESQLKLMAWFYSRIQSSLYGRDWASLAPRPRVHGYREHPNSNPHYHALVVANPIILAAIADGGDDLWKTKVPRGQLDVRLIEAGTTDQLIYCTKSLTHQQAWDDRFIYGSSKG